MEDQALIDVLNKLMVSIETIQTCINDLPERPDYRYMGWMDDSILDAQLAIAGLKLSCIPVQVKSDDVRLLREETGEGLILCKKALVACKGDVDKAVEWIHNHGNC